MENIKIAEVALQDRVIPETRQKVMENFQKVQNYTKSASGAFSN